MVGRPLDISISPVSGVTKAQGDENSVPLKDSVDSNKFHWVVFCELRVILGGNTFFHTQVCCHRYATRRSIRLYQKTMGINVSPRARSYLYKKSRIIENKQLSSEIQRTKDD